MRLLMILFLVSSSVGPLRAEDGLDHADVLSRRSIEWMSAVERKDRATLERIVSPGFRLVAAGESSAAVPREAWIGNAIRLDWTDRGYENMRVDVLGDVAVVSSQYAFRMDPGAWKPAISASASIVDVWVRRGGGWQVERRYLGGSSITRWLDRAVGFLLAAAILATTIVVRRVIRRKPRQSIGHVEKSEARSFDALVRSSTHEEKVDSSALATNSDDGNRFFGYRWRH